MNLEEFYEDFSSELKADAVDGFLSSTFIENMCNVIAEQGGIPDATLVEYKIVQRGIAVDAYALDTDRDRCALIIGDYHNSSTIESETKTDIENSLKRLDRFLEACGKGSFIEALEDSDPVVPLARYIYDNRSSISFSYILITNAKIGDRVSGEITPEQYGLKYAKHCEVWDIQRFFELESSGREREVLEIDFTQYSKNGIECLRASTGEASLQSFLFVLPGNVLADLYEKYGERLFEQNVRTFLQFRGKVNKGIKNTIMQQPSMFFSYNNGLSATAEDVVTDKNGSRIQKITNLQIVNGGQTTASIYTAWKKERANLDEIFVQVKLSVVESEKVNEVVPKISEYANTQNKVNAADFFSNHPFHLRIEEFSRHIWAPAAQGKLRQTHWFYERARGQYANAQAKLTKAEAARFLEINPKDQMFTKTDLAKYYLTFNGFPFIVCMGAQKAFAGSSGYKGFVSIIANEWVKNRDGNGNNISINEMWFKKVIAQAIFFKSLNKSIAGKLRDLNYGSYKSVIVPYTLSLFDFALQKTDFTINYSRVWQEQRIPDAIMDVLDKISDDIINYFMDKNTNVSEYAKKEICWQEIQKTRVELPEDINDFLIYKNEASDEQNEAKRTQKSLNGIDLLNSVFEKGDTYWRKLLEWDNSHHMLSPKERNIVQIASRISQGMIPSDAQLKVLVAAEGRAVEEGFYVP